MNKQGIIETLNSLKLHTEVKSLDLTKIKKYVEFCIINDLGIREKYNTSIHHILPQSYFKEYANLKENSWNCVHLTHENHYLAHKMLSEAIDDNKMMYAFWSMSNQGVGKGLISERLISASDYQKLREDFARKHSTLMTGKKRTKEQNENNRKAQMGKRLSKETKDKISKSNIGKHELKGEHKKLMDWTGRTHSRETKDKISKRKIGIKLSEETKRKIRISSLGRSHSIETRKKLSESKKGVTQKQVVCQYCGKSGGISNMKRYHFEKCKFK